VSPGWTVVLLVGVATIAMKGAGPVLFGGRELPSRLTNVMTLLAPAVLTALIVTAALGGDRRFEFDARLVGVAVAGVALWRKAPILIVLVAAAGATALVRAVA
jgi:branched chain amino acid efflux pump